MHQCIKFKFGVALISSTNNRDQLEEKNNELQFKYLSMKYNSIRLKCLHLKDVSCKNEQIIILFDYLYSNNSRVFDSLHFSKHTKSLNC